MPVITRCALPRAIARGDRCGRELQSRRPASPSLRGLNGDQGVIIPSGNVTQLMLRQYVVDAVATGRFSLYALQTVDQGLDILTGMPSGIRDALDRFPAGTLNATIEERLIDFADHARNHYPFSRCRPSRTP
jgi:hypothetical protein